MSANPMTIKQLLALQKANIKGWIIMNMMRQSPLFEYWPFYPAKALTVQGFRWRNLPDVETRRVNEGYTPSHGDFEDVSDSLYGMGGEINWDRVNDLIDGGTRIKDPRKEQILMKLEALKIKFIDLLINGDPGTDPDAVKGLKYRNSNMPSRQKINFAASASAAALDPTASTANALRFLKILRTIRKRTNNSKADMYLANEDFYLGLGHVLLYLQANGGNILDVTQDSFGRDIVTLWGAPVIDVGYKKDQETEIITNTETAGDGGSDATSIYGVSFDEKEGIVGAQLEPFNPYDPLNGGEMESLPAKLLRIDWWWGLVSFGSYGFTRGWNLEDPTNWTA